MHGLFGIFELQNHRPLIRGFGKTSQILGKTSRVNTSSLPENCIYSMLNWFGQVFHDDWGMRSTAESPEFFPPNSGSGTLNRNRFFSLLQAVSFR